MISTKLTSERGTTRAMGYPTSVKTPHCCPAKKFRNCSQLISIFWRSKTEISFIGSSMSFWPRKHCSQCGWILRAHFLLLMVPYMWAIHKNHHSCTVVNPSFWPDIVAKEKTKPEVKNRAARGRLLSDERIYGIIFRYLDWQGEYRTPGLLPNPQSR